MEFIAHKIAFFLKSRAKLSYSILIQLNSKDSLAGFVGQSDSI